MDIQTKWLGSHQSHAPVRDSAHEVVCSLGAACSGLLHQSRHLRPVYVVEVVDGEGGIVGGHVGRLDMSASAVRPPLADLQGWGADLSLQLVQSGKSEVIAQRGCRAERYI